MARPTFEHLTDFYDQLVDWPKRLGHEEPFYRRLFQRVEARSLLDVACGTGRHAAMWHSWGLRVEGADISPQMIGRARDAYGDSPELRWVVRGFGEPFQPDNPFDIALCVGNSLALAPDIATVQEAIRQMLNAVRAGGAIVLHLLNLQRLPDGPCNWQKCKRIQLANMDAVALKGVHRCGSHGYVDIVVLSSAEGDLLHSESVPLLGMEATDLECFAARDGAKEVEIHGGYQDQPFDAEQSVDLLMVAWK